MRRSVVAAYASVLDGGVPVKLVEAPPLAQVPHFGPIESPKAPEVVPLPASASEGNVEPSPLDAPHARAMVAGRLATLQVGRPNENAPIGAIDQVAAAESLKSAPSADVAPSETIEPWRGGPREARILRYHSMAGGQAPASAEPLSRDGWELVGEERIGAASGVIVLEVHERRRSLLGAIRLEGKPTIGAGSARILRSKVDRLYRALATNQVERAASKGVDR